MFWISVDFFSFRCIILRKTSCIVHGSQKKEFVDDAMVVVRLMIGIFDAIFGPILIK